MPAPLLIDLTHTSHTRARTGVQRVARAQLSALAAVPITHDPHRGAWRPLASWEEENITAQGAARSRGARWPLGSRLRGYARRMLGGAAGKVAVDVSLAGAQGLLVPEIFSPATAAALPALFAAVRGPRVAVFHDAVALKLPELTPAKTVARFPAYLQELLAFDGIVAVSADSKAALVDYWRWLRVPAPPPVEVIPHGIERPHAAAIADAPSPAGPPTILCVGSVEGRKNHVALLEACEARWSAGDAFQLHLIGLAHPQTGAAALAKIHALQAAGRALRYDGPVTDAALAAAYAGCRFTVYPSLLEGFGLPVFESLIRGKPCICSARGALGEAARGGGVLALDSVDAASVAAAIARLLADPAKVAALAAAAGMRTFPTWEDHAAKLRTWMSQLRGG